MRIITMICIVTLVAPVSQAAVFVPGSHPGPFEVGVEFTFGTGFLGPGIPTDADPFEVTNLDGTADDSIVGLDIVLASPYEFQPPISDPEIIVSSPIGIPSPLLSFDTASPLTEGSSLSYVQDITGGLVNPTEALRGATLDIEWQSGLTQSVTLPSDQPLPMSFQIVTVPEPSSIALLLAGIGSMIVFVKLKKRK